MTSVLDPIPLQRAIGTSTNALIDFLIYSDENRTSLRTLTGLVVLVWIADPSGTNRSYTATNYDQATYPGRCYITLAGANHVTAGSAQVQIYVDGALAWPLYLLTFILKLS